MPTMSTIHHSLVARLHVVPSAMQPLAASPISSGAKQDDRAWLGTSTGPGQCTAAASKTRHVGQFSR
eukprot:scaffold210576_cov49-Prasinocladus_malaysianus.AAC.2